MPNQNEQKKESKITNIKRLFFISLIIFTFTTFVFFFLIQNASVINKLAFIFKDQTGFIVRIGDISLSPVLHGEIRDLNISQPDDGNIFFSIAHADIQGGIDKNFRGEIQKAVLKEPKLSLVVAKGGKKADLSFLNKLPPVEFLEITKGEIHLLLKSEELLIRLNDINLNLSNFSPEKGGKIHLKCRLNAISTKDNKEQGIGHAEGDFVLSRFQPTPLGKGNIRLQLDNFWFKSVSVQNLVLNMSLDMKADEVIIFAAAPVTGSLIYKRNDKDIVFKNMELAPFASYKIKTGQLLAGIKNGMTDFAGAFDISVESTLKGDYPWKASIKALSINFEKAWALFGDFLPAQYNRWSFQGSGAIEAAMEGDYKSDRLSGKGKMALHFKEGGFSSPDGEKAAQGVTGRFIMNIRIPTQAEKGQLDISSEIGVGEFLWGKYYKDFSGKEALILSNGSIHYDSSGSFVFSGNLELADAGRHHYSGFMKKGGWGANLESKDIDLQEFFSKYMRDYLSQNIPTLPDISVKGVSRFNVNLNGSERAFAANGIITISEGYASIPNTLSGAIDLTLPFDIYYPSPHFSAPPANNKQKGHLYIKTLEIASAKIEDLNIPLILSENTLWVPVSLNIPFSGGTLELIHFKGENLLSSSLYFTTGLNFNDIEIGSHIGRFAGIDIPAKLDAGLPEIIYQNESLTMKGKAEIGIFGGKVVIDNMHGRKVFSHSRVIGGDITFERINLSELTNYVGFGRMSGIIQGSLDGMEIEYGQPSRFVLDIESVPTKGVPQNVSVDAIENISILGSGSQGMGVLLKSGMNRFFKNYHYSRIGIICILENDVFTIRGKIHDGGKEYLIRKGFLSGIDVINQNPENNVGFRDMMERINRVFEKKQGTFADKST